MSDAQLAVLSTRNLRTYFFTDEGVVKAVDGATFDLYAGKTLGIVGESGCGKSVTAQSILRIVDQPGRIVGGEIILRRAGLPDVNLVTLAEEGRDMYSIRGKEIALVFQEPMTSFSPVHTIGFQIMETLRLHHPAIQTVEVRRRAVEALARVGIPRPEQTADSYSHQLSGGLRQRAMIAMALVCDPRILIADEPTTALDVTTQAQILDLLRQMQAQRGMSIILITHNLGVIAEMADDVAVMYLGRVVEQGPVDAVFHAPKHPYTQALLRSIPSIRSKSHTILPTIAGSVPHPYNRPPGCPFHPRCSQSIRGTCNSREPQSVTVAREHETACFLFEGA